MTHAIHISGATRLYAIVGDPVAQTRSPTVYSERFAATGTNAVMLPAHVNAKDFDRVIPALMALGNLDGLLVTAPFKARMLPFAQRLGATATCIGALNALRREADGSWSGDMFDGAGFVRGAERKGERLAGRHVLLFGAGGAGSAIACALAEAGATGIEIVDRHGERAGLLTKALRNAFPGCNVTVAGKPTKDFNMVVNATPIGMKAGDGLPADMGSLTPDTLVGDAVISETPTAMIRLAQRDGCSFVNGHDMHSGQIEALLSFFARPAPRPAASAH